MAPQVAVVTVPPEAMNPYVVVVQAVQVTARADAVSVQAEHPVTPVGAAAEPLPAVVQAVQTPDNK